MTREEAQIGLRVRSLVEFSGVPKGSQGVIDEFYDGGLMVAWDLRPPLGKPLPPGYRQHDGQPTIRTGILRDGFDIERELQFLEVA